MSLVFGPFRPHWLFWDIAGRPLGRPGNCLPERHARPFVDKKKGEKKRKRKKKKKRKRKRKRKKRRKRRKKKKKEKKKFENAFVACLFNLIYTVTKHRSINGGRRI